MLIETIDMWAHRAPRHIAHQYRDGAMTYAALKTHSDALALWLQEQAPPGPVVVYGHKQSGMITGFLACTKAGRPYVPVDVSAPPERLRRIVGAAGATVLLAAGTLPAGAVAPLAVADVAPDSPAPPYAAYMGQAPPRQGRLQPGDVCYIIFTSGSTGVPKGVPITLGSLESFLAWVTALYQPRETAEVFLNQAPFSFDLSVLDLYLSLQSGSTLWSIDRDHAASPRELFLSLGRSRTTFWVSTPSFAEMCLADRAFNASLLPGLRYFLFCGEVLTNTTAAALIGRFPAARVENMYGPTEATVAVTAQTVTAEVLAAYDPLPVGRPKPDCRVLVCPPEELTGLIRQHAGRLPAPPEPVPGGRRGEIVIAGPSVSSGYLGGAADAFFSWEEDGRVWPAYRTGDSGYREDGLLFCQGRMDSQVKLHGYRIELGEIEENLRRVAGVENAVVLGVEQDGRLAYLKAFVTTAEPVADAFAARRKLRESLRQKLPEYMVPRSFAFIDRLPVTPNGKVDRRRLLEEHR